MFVLVSCTVVFQKNDAWKEKKNSENCIANHLQDETLGRRISVINISYKYYYFVIIHKKVSWKRYIIQ